MFVNEPVRNGTSCATLISASSLSSVMIEGVCRMLRVAVAAQRAQQQREVRARIEEAAGAERQAARQAALGSMLSGSVIAAAMLPMLEPPTGWLNVPIGTVLSESVLPTAQFTPSSAALVLGDVDQDRLDQHLQPADVELVHDRHDRAHDLRRRGDDERVGLLVRPDRRAAVGGGLRCRPRAPGAPGAACVMPVTCSFSLPAICSASA